MAFTLINEDQKQSINLSEEAWVVVRQDMSAFGCKSHSGFFNRVILNYLEDANATLSRFRQHKFEEFYAAFTEAPETEDAQRAFQASLKKLPLAQRKDAAKILADNAVRLYKETVIECYPKGSSRKFRISNDLFTHLTGSSECQERDAYDDHIGRYLKAILEEYARLPYHRRERIYYAQLFTDIENAIAAQKRLKITVSNGTEYTVKPYRILTDSQSTYHYLVAWHMDSGKAWPFRVSNIRKLRQLSSSGKITENDMLSIEKALQEKDVPFMGEDAQTIRVQLTPQGLQKYDAMLHMRPRYTSIEKGNIYVFQTTARQVQYYFEKFGPDAKILEPADLAQRMQQWHQSAARQYE